jgi:hypothetical protein
VPFKKIKLALHLQNNAPLPDDNEDEQQELDLGIIPGIILVADNNLELITARRIRDRIVNNYSNIHSSSRVGQKY